MHINLTKQRKTWLLLSGLLCLFSLVIMGVSTVQHGYPLRPGLDFVGGTRLQLERDCSNPSACTQPIDQAKIREVLSQQGLGNSSLQAIGDKQQGISIRTGSLKPEERDRLEQALSSAIGPINPAKKQIDSVGPVLGQQTLISALWALGLSFLGIGLYLTFRFQFDYAVLAVVALVHDVILTCGAFAVFGIVFGTEVDSLFVVALLTITGFSVNDTVVIYDRIREVIKLNPEMPVSKAVEDAVNQTLTRSINTTLTVLLTLTSIFLFGGATLKDFALALIIGFTLGAYSSIFIASSLFSWWRERARPEPSLDLSETAEE